MKRKIIVSLLGLALVLSSASCGQQAKPPEHETSSFSSSVAAESPASDSGNAEPEAEAEEAQQPSETPPETTETTLESPPEPEAEPEAAEPSYSFQDLSKVMYTVCSLNVRSSPEKSGEQVGTLREGAEVAVTGQCNETGWFRISFQNQDAYVSNRYLTEEKPVEETMITNQTTGENHAGEAKTDAGSSTVETPENTNSERPEKETDWVASLDVAQRTNQILAVAATGSTATVSFHVKDSDGNWSEKFTTSGYIGANGLGKTKEGDKKTPIGAYTFTTAFGICDDPGCSMAYTKVDDSYYWVDDPESQYYNQFVSTNTETQDWTSAEHIVSAGAVYHYVLALDYNSACVPGAGSAIFLHCSAGRATAGCIAIPEAKMIELLKMVNSNCVILIDTPQNIKNN